MSEGMIVWGPSVICVAERSGRSSCEEQRKRNLMADGDHQGSAPSDADELTLVPTCGLGDAVPAEATARYLDELVKEAGALDVVQSLAPETLRHARTLLTREMERVCTMLYTAPDAATGAVDQSAPIDAGGVTIERKIPMPDHPRCNLIGRILGPRGISVKQLEQETGCHILVRGEGSVKDPRREARLRNYAGWEHLSEPLHVLVSATDVTKERAELKLQRAVDAVKRLLTPVRNDEHKRRQLMQLAIINGTYRTLEPSPVLSRFGRP